ncbi:uncharacterized protein LOC110433718 [Sorghum bicolor]|uniref:uncharacterized protein LOC110433718 n=1 Tax=Sorghum bicolor TaxID=4558 RepID=UPI000B4249F9|nr:uncharacterized protein LOC110433718 [Sorghum bicolor]|eukprot:XP_021311910.1 uncharacterized protein LOC110433718 [Sorghum bicolor]
MANRNNCRLRQGLLKAKLGRAEKKADPLYSRKEVSIVVKTSCPRSSSSSSSSEEVEAALVVFCLDHGGEIDPEHPRLARTSIGNVPYRFPSLQLEIKCLMLRPLCLNRSSSPLSPSLSPVTPHAPPHRRAGRPRGLAPPSSPGCLHRTSTSRIVQIGTPEIGTPNQHQQTAHPQDDRIELNISLVAHDKKYLKQLQLMLMQETALNLRCYFHQSLGTSSWEWCDVEDFRIMFVKALPGRLWLGFWFLFCKDIVKVLILYR